MEKKIIHQRYVISYLLAIIVLILTIQYNNVDQLGEKLSFALTLSSLLLAVIAIFFTIISANKQDMQLSNMLQTQTSISNSADEIKNVSKQLNGIVSTVPIRLTELNDKIDSLPDVFTDNSSKIQSEPDFDYESYKKKIFIKDKLHLIYVMSSMQYQAMAVIYLFVKAYLSKREIELNHWEEVDIVSGLYAVGVLGVFKTTNLIDFDNIETNLKPVKCDKLLLDHIDEFIQKAKPIANESNESFGVTIEKIETKYA